MDSIRKIFQRNNASSASWTTGITPFWTGLILGCVTTCSLTGVAYIAFSKQRSQNRRKQLSQIDDINLKGGNIGLGGQLKELIDIASTTDSSFIDENKENFEGRYLPENIEEELFSRVISFFGDKNDFQKIQNSFIIVVGLGGVGSHAAHMLARSGCGHLRLVDFDQVSLSSLNRHALATFEDVGKPKSQVMRSRLLKIIPSINIEAINQMFKKDTADKLLADGPTLVLDCIDDINTKADLLEACKQKNIKVITSLGAALKADPTRLHIGELSTTSNDPLATRLRYMLRKRKVDIENIPIVFSSEKAVREMLPLEDDQMKNPQNYGNVDNMRIRVLPVLGTMPALFGQALASWTLCYLTDQLFAPTAFEGLSKAVKSKFYNNLKNREAKNFNNPDSEIFKDDLEYSLQSIWQCRCAISGNRIGHAGKTFTFTRWNREKLPTVDNLIFVETKYADKLDTEGPHFLDDPVRNNVERKLRAILNR